MERELGEQRTEQPGQRGAHGAAPGAPGGAREKEQPAFAGTLCVLGTILRVLHEFSHLILTPT